MADGDAKIVEFDIRGQICPSTLLVALREMNRSFAAIDSGSVKLLFLTDNRDCIGTIPEAAANMGLHCSVEKSESGYGILVSK